MTFPCPLCGRGNFTAIGLRHHWCAAKATARSKSARLSREEWEQAVHPQTTATMPKSKPKPKPKPATDAPPANGKPAKPKKQPLPSAVRYFPIADVVVEEGFNVRTDFGESLADSIFEHGIRSPLIGYLNSHGKPVLVEGERRLRSAFELIASGRCGEGALAKFQVPFLIQPELNDPAQRTAAMLTFGTTGKPLTMSERARGCKRLAELGLDNAEIAERVNTTPTAVADCLDLLSIVAPEILAAVDAGRTSATMALDLARTVPDQAQQLEYFRQGEEAAGGADARVTAKHLPVPIGKVAKAKKAAAPPPPMPDDSQQRPFAEAGDTTVDGEGRIWKCEEIPIEIPKEARAKVTLLLAERAGLWRTGYEIKWPGKGKGDGWHKELPSVTGPGDEERDRAELLAAQHARGELEARDFFGGDKEAAIDALGAHITRLTRDEPATTPPQRHAPPPPPAPDDDDDPPPPPQPGTRVEVLDGILENIPASEAIGERYETLRLIADTLGGRLGAPVKARQLLMKWVIGVLLTRAEVEADL